MPLSNDGSVYWFALEVAKPEPFSMYRFWGYYDSLELAENAAKKFEKARILRVEVVKLIEKK